ncbi:type III pantothenate kinase [Adlercreutzia agrestimuris]|uniref:type III pantothenate kinase n=1 Tax=Adlercreutzia agrestimuris TaxID=2941324 RepID=UPI00203B863A|nr:type III pantothenate kinase [Adlercreutzia agrestimuris]
MLLAVDVGNTQTVIGVFRGEELCHRWRFATNKSHTGDDLRVKLMALLNGEGISFDQLGGMALASVVPHLTDAWDEVSYSLTKTPALVCTAQTAGELFSTNYPRPSEIGSDRIADAVAARASYGAPVIVVDFGTATNIEVIDEQGSFCGGVIAPGLETAAHALFNQASMLAGIHFVDPETAIGTNTAQALQIGILYGEADRADGLIRRVFDQLGYTAPVIATGGLSVRIAPHSQTITQVDRNLTLLGLRLVFEHNLAATANA